MGGDDGPANRKPHPHSAGLRGVERFEHLLELFRINPWAGIAHRHEHTTAGPALLGLDRQLSRPILDRAHCFDSVQDQVHDDLLELNTIAQNRRQLQEASAD